jgi:hypothetical protein
MSTQIIPGPTHYVCTLNSVLYYKLLWTNVLVRQDCKTENYTFISAPCMKTCKIKKKCYKLRDSSLIGTLSLPSYTYHHSLGHCPYQVTLITIH